MVDFFKYVNEMEEQNIRLSQKHFPEDLQKYELSVNVLAQTLHEVNQSFIGRMLKPEKKIATVLLSSRFMVASKCLFNIFLHGYYYEAHILLRSLQENVFLCLSFIESNDCAKQWLTKNGLRLKEVKRIIKFSSRPLIKEAYGFMSDFVHSNMPAIARSLKFEEKSKVKPQERPEFRMNANNLLKAFRALNTSMLLILVEIFKEDLDGKTKDVIMAYVREEQKELGLQITPP
jgi:predicted nucleotidyltransferase